MRSSRLTAFLVLAAVFATSVSAAPGPFARDQFIAELAGNIGNHFKLEGELQLELLRPWSPPTKVAHGWAIEVLEYPTVPSASMLLRCRVLADGVAAGDSTLVLRAALWRDVWVAREPLISGSTFNPTELETRRVDLFRERDALPAIVGDRSY